MKLKNIGFKALALSIGAASLLGVSSCKDDFLDGKNYDHISAESFKTYDNVMGLTGALYGGKLWSDYDQKFSWVMEGASGNLYNVYADEGMPFLLQLNANNPHFLSGYKCLYSGVISAANQIIHFDFSKTELTEQQKNEVIAEAKLWRGLAHFYATEYWGEVPVILDNEKDIANNVMIPKCSREVVYAAVEKDFQDAIQYLPETRDDSYKCRATVWSAKAMLAKLYLTMAACRRTEKEYACSNSDALYEEVIKLTTEIINSNQFSLETHEAMFGKPYIDKTAETILAFHYPKDGGWLEGSQYGCQMANKSEWSLGEGWGSGKGIAYTLYHDFDDNDPRKKELCMCVGNKYIPYYNPFDDDYSYKVYDEAKKDSVPNQKAIDLLGSIGVLNNVKKYVYGLQESGHTMSTWARFDIVRFSDIYLMRQEAKMLKGGAGVSTPCADLSDLNTVLSAHGAATKSGSMAFYTKVEGEIADITFDTPGKSYSSRNAKGDLHPFVDANKRLAEPVKMYHNTHRTDFIQELRKEFAMEGHGWFDLKRLFYLDKNAAESFLYEQDRACQLAVKCEFDPKLDADKVNQESGYERLALHNDILNQRALDGEKVKVGSSEETINVDGFIRDGKWFLPFPSSSEVVAKMSSEVYRDANSIKNDTYPY